jgi:lipoprotein NlpD
MRRARWFGLLALVILLGACGEAHVVRQEPEPTHADRVAAPIHRAGAYEVTRGDTLYGVAFRNGMDFRELAAINGIDPPYTIYVGQMLRLHGDRSHAPAAASAVSPSPRTVRAPTPIGPRPSHPTVRPSPVAGAAVPPQSPTAFESVPAASDAAQNDASTSLDPDPVHAMPADPSTSMPSHAGPPAVIGADNATASMVDSVSHPAATPRTPSAAILPSVAASAGGVGWHWPARGALLERFAAGDATRQGIDIAGTAGEPVLATADGVVVYSGSGLVGYGELVIVKHSDEWLSAYGHNRKRLVQEGQRVRAGQPIAEMGSTGAPRDELHFEIRRNGRPVDPLQYLPGAR